MLDPEAPDEQREKIAADARGRIESAGEMRHSEAWGMRKMAFEIRQRTEADYRFFRFQAEPSLLDDLDHPLKITDGVLRFRVFKVDPRAPIISPPPPGSAPRGRREGRDGRDGRDGRSRRSDDGDEEAPSSEPESDAVPAEPAPQAASTEPVAEAASAPPAAEPPAAEPPAAGPAPDEPPPDEPPPDELAEAPSADEEPTA